MNNAEQSTAQLHFVAIAQGSDMWWFNISQMCKRMSVCVCVWDIRQVREEDGYADMVRRSLINLIKWTVDMIPSHLYIYLYVDQS